MASQAPVPVSKVQTEFVRWLLRLHCQTPESVPKVGERSCQLIKVKTEVSFTPKTESAMGLGTTDGGDWSRVIWLLPSTPDQMAACQRSTTTSRTKTAFGIRHPMGSTSIITIPLQAAIRRVWLSPVPIVCLGPQIVPTPSTSGRHESVTAGLAAQTQAGIGLVTTRLLAVEQESTLASR
jgi:hypothetical protein